MRSQFKNQEQFACFLQNVTGDEEEPTRKTTVNSMFKLADCSWVTSIHLMRVMRLSSVPVESLHPRFE